MKLRFLRLVLASALVFGGVALADDAPVIAADPSVVTTPLGTLGGTKSVALDVNDNGEVVGFSSGGTPNRAFSWTAPGGMIDLGTINGGPSAEALSVNNGGQILMTGLDGDLDDDTALWTSGVKAALGTGWNNGTPPSLNDSGEIAGACASCPGHGFFRDTGGSIENIGTLGGSDTRPFAITSVGVVVGSSLTGALDWRAFSWVSGGSLSDLGTLGGDNSEALAASDAGHIVGWAETSTGNAHPFSWTAGGGMIDLLDGTSWTHGEAVAVNEAGQVVGTFSDALDQPHAFSWTPSGGLVDLGSMGGELATATDVAEGGQVVGYFRDGSNVFHAFSWTNTGGIVDLDIGRALAVNDNGQIVGVGETGIATMWVDSAVAVTGTVASGGSLGTNPNMSPTNPLATLVQSPNAGTVTIVEETSAAVTPPSGYEAVGGQLSRVTAPGASVADPLIITFTIDVSVWAGIPLGSLSVLRNGTLVADCASPGLSGAADPDPCIGSRTGTPWTSPAEIVVRTSQASEWLVVHALNGPPVCDAALADSEVLWPPNHKFRSIEISGVTDPDGDPTVVTISSIFQDEPVNASGDGSTSPDASGIGTSVADVRAERVGSGDGRVYHIGFTAHDDAGGSCVGEVTVGVPTSKRGVIHDGGALYDSTDEG